MEPYYFFSGRQRDPAQGQSPEGVRRQRKMADTAIGMGASTAPVQGGTVEALTRMLTGGIGGYMAGQANQAEKAGQAQANAQFQQALGAGSDPWNGLRQPSGNPGASPSTPTAPLSGLRQRLFGY